MKKILNKVVGVVGAAGLTVVGWWLYKRSKGWNLPAEKKKKDPRTYVSPLDCINKR